MGKNSSRDPYEELANAIILQTVKDYRDSSKKLARGRKNAEEQRMYDECLRFFRSGWFSALTDIDPGFLIEKLDKEVRDDS